MQTDSCDVFTANRLWSFPTKFAIFGWVQLNGRMTVMGLEDGGLLLHSPIALTEERKNAVAALGTVRAIIAPNLLHHLYVSSWQEAFPDALTFAPAKLQKKRPDLRIDHELGPAFDEHFGVEIERFAIEGMPFVREHLFFHRASGTLVLTDLSFYLPTATGATGFYAFCNGVGNQPNTPLLFRLAIRSRDDFRRSLAPLYDLEVQHLAMCHDQICSENPSTHLHRLLQRLGVPKSG